MTFFIFALSQNGAIIMNLFTGIIYSILHYESSKEHITYRWMNYIRATKERVTLNPRVRNLVATRVMYYTFCNLPPF
jgi:hypothetical protein